MELCEYSDSLLSWVKVLANNIVSIYHSHHLLLTRLTLPLGLFSSLVIIVMVVFCKTESFCAESHNTQNEYYDSKDTKEDNEDYCEGVQMRGS